MEGVTAPLLPKDKKDKKKNKDSKEEKKEDSEEMDAVEATYRSFKENNKSFWTWFLIMVILLSVGLAASTVYLISLENAMDCGGLLYVLYLMVFFHMVNFIVAILALTGLELKVCTNNACCFYALFVFLCIVGVQVGYFNAMANKCFINGKIVYTATFLQIIVMYLFITYTVCKIFRENCQTPEEEEVPEEILELREDTMKKAKRGLTDDEETPKPKKTKK